MKDSLLARCDLLTKCIFDRLLTSDWILRNYAERCDLLTKCIFDRLLTSTLRPVPASPKL